MFLVVNMVLIAAAAVLVLVIAATASIPGRHLRGDNAVDAQWIRPARSPGGTQWRGPEAEQTALPPEVAAAGMQ